MLRLATAAAALAVAAAPGIPLPRAPRCPLPPAGFTLDRRVDRLPVAPDSDRMVAAIGAGAPMHADFGSGRYEGRPIGIPFDVVSKATPRATVRFDYADESDRVRYPIPAGVHIEGGGERLRLKASVDVGRFPPQARAVLRALREYGGIVADNGSAWFVSGAPDPRWDDDQLATLRRIQGSDFEVGRVRRR